MFLQFVVHAHAKSLPTTAAKANPNRLPGRAQRCPERSDCRQLHPTRRHLEFQLNVSALVATKFPEYPKKVIIPAIAADDSVASEIDLAAGLVNQATVIIGVVVD